MSSLPRHNGKADTSVTFVVLCEAENYVQKMLLRNIFSLRFFSKIKIYFTVMLTTSNQKFLKFFSWTSSNKVLTEHSKKFNLFLLIVNTLSRHTILIFSKKIIVFRQLFFLKLFQLRFQSC